jgi:hypothetical protein
MKFMQGFEGRLTPFLSSAKTMAQICHAITGLESDKSPSTANSSDLFVRRERERCGENESDRVHQLGQNGGNKCF